MKRFISFNTFRVKLGINKTSMVFLYTYHARKKFINIRKQPKLKQQIVSQQLKDMKIEESLKNVVVKPQKNNWARDSKHKEFHDLNLSIKNSDRISNLLYIFQKNHKTMTIQQHLALLDKIIAIDNQKGDPISNYTESINEAQSNTSLYEKICSKVLDKFQYFFFYCKSNKIETNRSFDSKPDNTLEQSQLKQQQGSSLPPEYYIGFINIMSKSKNKKLLHYTYHKIILKILESEFIINVSEQWHKKKDKQENIESISEVLTLDDNVRMIKSLFRLYANKDLHIQTNFNKEDRSNKDLLAKLIRSIMKYLHLPLTPSQLPTPLLSQLTNLYIKGYPTIKIPKNILKSLIRQSLRRIKIRSQRFPKPYEKKTRKKSAQKQQQQLNQPLSFSVLMLKNLFQLQKLLSIHFKHNSLVSQILLTKQNNLAHNQFFMIQQKIHKIITKQLIISAKNQRSQKNFNQYIDMLPMLANHIQYLYSKIPIQVLAKCDMLTQINQQMEHVIQFLGLINAEIGRDFSGIQKSFRNKNEERLFAQFLKVLSKINLSTEIRKKLPGPIFNKIMRGKVLQSLLLNYTAQAKDMKAFLISYLSRVSDIDDIKNKETLKFLVRGLLEDNIQEVCYSMKNNKEFSDIFYLFSLLSDPNYLKLLKQLTQTEKLLIQNQKKIFKDAIKGILNNLHEKSFWPQFLAIIYNNQHTNESHEINNITLITKISEIISGYSSERKQQIIPLIVSKYQKASIRNQSFSNDNIQKLSIYHSYLTHINSNPQQIISAQKDTMQNRKSPKVREQIKSDCYRKNEQKFQKQELIQIIQEKINIMFSRLSFMVVLGSQIYKNPVQQASFQSKVLQIYKQESQLLRFPTAYTYEHIQQFFFIEKYLLALENKQDNIQKNTSIDLQSEEEKQQQQFIHKNEGEVYKSHCTMLRNYEDKYKKQGIAERRAEIIEQLVQKVYNLHQQFSQDEKLLIKFKNSGQIQSLQTQDNQLFAIGQTNFKNQQNYSIGYILHPKQQTNKEIISILRQKYYLNKYSIKKLIYIPIH